MEISFIAQQRIDLSRDRFGLSLVLAGAGHLEEEEMVEYAVPGLFSRAPK